MHITPLRRKIVILLAATSAPAPSSPPWYTAMRMQDTNCLQSPALRCPQLQWQLPAWRSVQGLQHEDLWKLDIGKEFYEWQRLAWQSVLGLQHEDLHRLDIGMKFNEWQRSAWQSVLGLQHEGLYESTMGWGFTSGSCRHYKACKACSKGLFESKMVWGFTSGSGWRDNTCKVCSTRACTDWTKQ